MSKYNKFAKRLDDAFKAAREAYNKLADEYETAAYNERMARGDVAKLTAHAKALEAREALRQSDPWNEYGRQVKTIRAELETELRKDGVVSADAVDSNAVILLESGVMDVDDYIAMAEKFDGNATMSKLISKYAMEAADNAENKIDRGNLYAISNNLRGGTAAMLRGFDELVKCAETYRGNGMRPYNALETSFNKAMSARWDSETVTAAIEGF